MSRLTNGCMGCLAATIMSGLLGMPASAGVLPLAEATVSSIAPGAVVSVQWTFSSWPRQPWDAPPYSFPQGNQSHVMYYAAAPNFYPSYQTTYGYNGHFGYPAAVQYADPVPPRRYYPPR